MLPIAGRTEWADIFLGTLMGGRGVLMAKKIYFFSNLIILKKIFIFKNIFFSLVYHKSHKFKLLIFNVLDSILKFY